MDGSAKLCRIGKNAKKKKRGHARGERKRERQTKKFRVLEGNNRERT